jgi:hypothetical protein
MDMRRYKVFLADGPGNDVETFVWGYTYKFAVLRAQMLYWQWASITVENVS